MSVSVDRRAMLGAAVALAGAATTAAAAPTKPKAPKGGFLWGTAGSSYQIEGGNVASEMWVLEHVKPNIFRAPSGDACDTYNRIDEDLALAASLGLNAHRFSIEWSRIQPERGEISEAGLAYYRRVLELCHKHGLTPNLTFNHWTVPRWFAAGGAFETPEGVAPFVDFCRLVTERMGDLVGIAATFNEANIRAQLSWIPALKALAPIVQKTKQAAAAAIGSERFSSPLLADFRIQQPIMLEAHARAYDAIKKIRPDLPVGVTLSLNDDQAAGPDSGLARKRAEVWEPWLAAPGDWVGVQTYTRSRVGPEADLGPEPGVELTNSGYEFRPEALEAVIREVAKRVKKPIYVTENGISTENDERRVAFIERAVAGVLACKADGIDLRGYFHWSLLDNWEWISGYSQHFGLVAVDRQTFKRTPKPSARYLGQIARSGRV